MIPAVVPPDFIDVSMDVSNDVRKRRLFGKLPGGEPVEAVTLGNKGGLQAQVQTLGAALQMHVTQEQADE